ncbi:hypothetical protein O6H91_15G068400 [Diphasiastrum complanatum]|uniref:Uncharacterized protein n=1 Tax=Diphasiastrum complanatum TaxID=34168 RepID=A0ACC2BJ74_DIPCM|nr:hypothetical protein O6H91_15G068400 [Diphasiastrum complanatum]
MFARGNILGGADGYDVVGSKRQRLLDAPYLSSATSAAAQGGLYGCESFVASYLGQPKPFPVVRLRGLPFNCSEADVFEFFAGLDVVDVLLVRKHGRFSGEAFVVFGAPVQVDFALKKNRQNMGRRYVEIFRSKKLEYYHAVAADVEDANLEDRPPSPTRHSRKSPDKDNLEHTGVLKLRGLPFSTSKHDIIDFFRNYDLKDENIHIVTHSDGRATGEAYVEFASPSDSKAAMNKDKMTLGSRYVELFPSSLEEATKAASKYRH